MAKADANKPATKKAQAAKQAPKEDTKNVETGFFDTKGMAYANLPKSNEEVTAGPYDPTVRGADKDGQIPA